MPSTAFCFALSSQIPALVRTASTLCPMRWVVGHLCVVPGGGLRMEVGLEEDALDALEMDEERLSSRSWYAKTPEDREPVEEIESERSMARAIVVTLGYLFRVVEVPPRPIRT